MRKRNALPPLDLLVGFESAARHLSFTKAGAELFLTQSAVSRQIKELEEHLGAALFERRHRALVLTDAGKEFYAATAQVLTAMRAAAERLRSRSGKRRLSVTTTHSFAALWLIPRLAGFTRDHPGVDVRIMAETRVQDLERDGLDLAIRHGPQSLAGSGAVRLFGERVFPVCSPVLLEKNPLRKPQDLRNHVLLQYDDPDGRHPWLHWKTWLEVERIADLRPAGTLSFSGYEQIIPAALAGHGVALGRTPLVKDLLAAGQLVAPFKSTADPARAYYAIVAPHATARREVQEFVGWLKGEAATARLP
ncbi:MAG TPA: transcriptional regulator GcvA [Burkholderiales bacterium]|nr:transcriptional regulator GcvA [Burkholderiales bacterium]